MTEKLLLFGGAIQLAGQVKAKRDRRSTRSDWMAIERERGISVVTSVMTFEYGGRVFNLLDTPGHEDFSEDTYRTLTAVDSAVMVIDAAKGIEPRTRKLFEVCRLRDIPIITFINKMDRESRDPFDLIDEIEKTLALDAAPIAWPIGRGRDFVGTIDVKSGGVRLLDGDSGSTGSLREMSLAEIAALNSNLDAAALGGELDLVRACLQAVRPASLCRGPHDSDLLRQRAEEFWRRRFAECTGRIGAAATNTSRRQTGRVGDRARHVGVCFQDPSQHGSEPSRSYRLRTALLRQAYSRHEGQADANREGNEPARAAIFLRPRAGTCRGSLCRATWLAYPITERCASATP